MQTASKRFSGEEDCRPVWVCWRWWKPAFQGEQHWMFPPSSIVSQRHCRGFFFLNPPFLSIRPSPHLTNWTFGARRHTTGTTTDTCWMYSAFVCKSRKTARVRECVESKCVERARPCRETLGSVIKLLILNLKNGWKGKKNLNSQDLSVNVCVRACARAPRASARVNNCTLTVLSSALTYFRSGNQMLQ